MTGAVPPEQNERRFARRAAGSGSGRSIPRVAVIYNPRSHRNRSSPQPDLSERHDVTAFQPAERKDLTAVLHRIRDGSFDTIVINGGDGTVRDVLTCGHPIFGDDWPRLCALPRGKTNALNIDLRGPGDITLLGALENLAEKPARMRRPLVLRDLDSPDAEPVLGFILGAGNFTAGTRAAQDAHRMGAFNGLAVALTIGWAVLQTLFGTSRNSWRAGVPMSVKTCADEKPLPHSGFGNRGRRALLFASTMDHFPLGVKPFAPRTAQAAPSIRLVAIDRPRRRVMAMLPLILAGYRPDWLFKAGLHQTETDCVTLTIDDEVILDGEAFPAGRYSLTLGPELEFVVP